MLKCMYPITVKRTDKSYFRAHMLWRLSDRTKLPPTHYVKVRCGKCYNCLRVLRQQWLYRLHLHMRNQVFPSYFVTLTYDENSIPVSGVVKSDVQAFMKRLRHTTKQKISYFLVSEYGDKTHRPHYHMIIFNYDGDPGDFLKCWSNGFVYVGTVTDASINYCAKYFMQKQLSPEGQNPNFSLISKGIARTFRDVRPPSDYFQNNGYLNFNGHKVSAPRYFREKWNIDPYRLPNVEVPDELDGLTDAKLQSAVSQELYLRNRIINKSRKL